MSMVFKYVKALLSIWKAMPHAFNHGTLKHLIENEVYVIWEITKNIVIEKPSWMCLTS